MLRACFATRLIDPGVELVKVTTIRGCKDLKTLTIYLRLAGVDEKGVVEGLWIFPKEDWNVLLTHF